MISAFDDFCIHQSPDYVRVPATTDRNFYDRYFFSGYHRAGDIIFGIAFGRYPNRHVQDAHFSVTAAGRQSSIHAASPLERDPASAAVGPLTIEILDPMRMLRCHGRAENIAWDLRFRAITGAIDEGRLRLERNGMTFIDQTRFMQYGSWEGWIEVDGLRHEIAPAACFGLRDKSWGVRLFAENHTTAERGGQIFWMNLVSLSQYGYSVMRVLDDADGRSHERTGYFAPVYEDSADVPIGETSLEDVADWRFDLDFVDGTRRIGAGRYQASLADGRERRFTARALGSFWYAGIGYNHDRWNHGLDHGSHLVLEREDWSVSEIDMSRLDRQMLLSVVEIEEDGHVIGFGHTEQLLMGPYSPLGWAADRYVGL
jgi:hypothetical protein